MKQGETILVKGRHGTPPRVEVGNDDRMVWVSFGTISVLLNNIGNINVITVRTDARDENGRPLPVDVRLSTDVRGAVEFRIGD